MTDNMGSSRTSIHYCHSLQRQQYLPCLTVVSVDVPVNDKQVFIVTVKWQHWLPLCTVVKLPNISYFCQQ